MAWLNTEFNEHSPIWIIISLGIGGAITAVINYLFQNMLPEFQKKRATRIAVQKYLYPISDSATTLRVSIQDMLSDPDKIKDEKYCLGVLYHFGCFLGWTKIFFNESFLEQFKEPHSNIERIPKGFSFASYLNLYLTKVLHVMSEPAFLGIVKIMSSDAIKSATIPRLAISAMGELMINEPKQDGESSTVIRIIDFEKNYRDCTNFKDWFSYLNNLITGINNSIANPNLNRLFLIHMYLYLFEAFLKRKKEIFLYKLIPRKIKKYFYIFISRKLSTYRAKRRALSWGTTLSEERLQREEEVLLYGSIFLKIKKYLNRKHQVRKSGDLEHPTRFVVEIEGVRQSGDLEDPTRFVVEKDPRKPTQLALQKYIVEGKDNIKYCSIYIPVKYPHLKRYALDHGYNEMHRLSVASYIGSGLLLDKVHPKVLSTIRSTELLVFGYKALLDRPYNEEIDDLLKDPASSKIWNNKGLLQDQLTNFDEAIKCYNEAINLDQKYAFAWNNKGLTCIKTEDYEEAIKCFEQAKTIWKNDLPNNKNQLVKQNLLISDSLNNKGVSHFNLDQYEEALKCFEEASDTLEPNLRCDEMFSIVSTNKSIAQSKLSRKA